MHGLDPVSPRGGLLWLAALPEGARQSSIGIESFPQLALRAFLNWHCFEDGGVEGAQLPYSSRAFLNWHCLGRGGIRPHLGPSKKAQALKMALGGGGCPLAWA